ncbi:hypothetical protein CPAR01_00630 [Colletotrichum paranaense]|uniref:Multicopper oxidase n=1 Tax=Colletotrichum paranaense TaxID=1914294 RepID=A0ABQ9T4F6_9PEZI|nr:uncharacterized protein CPAR01_00630 [Colletotrichum paranaense]KAK1546663.1 hypothetical protein CPAR01_00630 [Colletotrichum paranaense]
MTFFKRLTEFLFFTPELSAQGRLATQLFAEKSSGLSFAGSCNTANNRECWSEGFNITTDYEKHVPDGIEREFYLEVDNHEIAPDGYLVQRMLFNGTYPGPTLEGNWGDTFNADGLVQLEYMGRPPAPDSMLMNGNGRYYCCPVGAGCNSDSKCVGGSNITTFNFKRGSSYKMSLVNTGTSTHTTFWIDHHNFTVVGTDFVPIKPYTASIINIAIGQRYDIIINANASKNTRTDFWIHARDCQIGGARSNLGIIRYDPTSTRLPWTPPVDDRHVCYGCLDESPKDLKPIVPRMVKNAANEGFEKDSLKVHLVGFPNDFDPDATLHKWVLKDSSLYLDWSQPSLSLVKIASDQGWENPKFPKGYEPVDLRSYKENSWVYFLIEGKFQESVDNATHKIYKKQAPVAHPMHIHGHDFVILDSGTTEFDPKNYTINRDNPPRRDVALLPVNGYLIIAFQIDNPGVWLMHCHIAWHASGGLALQFIEQPEKLSRQFGDSGRVDEFSKTCTNWAAYYTMFNKNYNATQDDSGI